MEVWKEQGEGEGQKGWEGMRRGDERRGEGMGEEGKGREGEKRESRGLRGREEVKRYAHEKSEVKAEQIKSERRTRMQQPLPQTVGTPL